MPESALMILIFFAIILGAVITLIVILAYQKHKFNNTNNKNSYENSPQIRRKLLIECEKQKNSSQQTKQNTTEQQKPNVIQSASKYPRQTNYNSPNQANRQARQTTQNTTVQSKPNVAQSTSQYPKQATTNVQKNNNNYLPYHRKYLLTKREYGFYKKLKPIADKYNLQVLAKIRFADLVEVDENVNPNYKQTWFYKIQAKHIDFAIADEMKIITLLELDDSTHSQADRIERDEFVNAVTKKCGYILIHTYGELENIENEMRKYRKSTLKAIS
ncbi:MAG: DUF2726 domain-containing protein [Ruminococcus sp.]|nr:DUF2726 domain-containing protein [Ruminococcus sp.]